MNRAGIDLTNLKELIKFAQIMPREMLQEIQRIATEKQVSLELEITSRLLATFIEPEKNLFSEQILKHKFSAKEAFAECKRKRETAHYLYEVERLRLFLSFETRLPRRVKESFTVIDVKAETKRIKAELKIKK